MQEFSIEMQGNKAVLYTPYNTDFVKKIKLAGAKWDDGRKAWVIDDDKLDIAKNIMREVYGRDDQEPADMVRVKVTFTEEWSRWHGPVEVLGHAVASAFGRDTGARVGDDVSFIAGAPKSGGSRANWTTIVPAGSVVILGSVPRCLLDAGLPRGVTVEVMEPAASADDLRAERERLLARVTNIEASLERLNG